ncbi:MAG: hypothetical protein Q8Q81_04870 [Oxalobacteraceae bacterium]|nr:hypothetical protein [Oxalobacteraceae bacterium]
MEDPGRQVPDQRRLLRCRIEGDGMAAAPKGALGGVRVDVALPAFGAASG